MNKSNVPLRLAVVGLGAMGQNHLRALEKIKSIQLNAVVDSNFRHAQDIARRLGCKAFESCDSLVGLVDAAIVVVPSVLHYEIGKYLLSHGIHCLIEKPLATTESECMTLIETASAAGATLMVGHIERFNPAVQQLHAYLDEGVNIYGIEARRMSATSMRLTDVDVVADLMIHDIDVICSISGKTCQSAWGVASKAAGVRRGDYVNAVLNFDDGSTASLVASRVTQNKTRELLLTTDHGSLTLNYLSQELHRHRLGQPLGLSPLSVRASHVLDYSTERFFIRYFEPLVLELQHFVEAVIHGTKPLIDGHDALRTMQIVWEIQRSI